MKTQLALITLAFVIGLSLACRESNYIAIYRNSTKEVFTFDLSRSTLPDTQKSLTSQGYYFPVISTTLAFTFNLMKCSAKSDNLMRRGHLFVNNAQWVPMSKQCESFDNKKSSIEKSIHNGYVSLITTSPKSKPYGFQILYQSERPVNGYTIETRLNVVCTGKSSTEENTSPSLIDYKWSGKIFTITYNHYSYAGCVAATRKEDPNHDDIQIDAWILIPFFLMFLTFWLMVFCCPICSCLACCCCCCCCFKILILSSCHDCHCCECDEESKAKSTTSCPCQRKEDPRVLLIPAAAVQQRPAVVPAAAVMVPEEKKEEKKPMQQVGVNIELQQVRLPVPPQMPMPQAAAGVFIGGQQPQQQQQYMFYPPINQQQAAQQGMMYIYPQQ